MPLWELVLSVVLGVPAIGIVAIPMVMIATHHRRKMAELRVQHDRLMREDVRAEFEAIREEIRGLRDTTMQYDLSFDTALHQIERRLNQIEGGKRITPSETIEQNVTLGGR